MEELITNEKTEIEYAHVWETLTREKILYQTTLGLDYLHGLEGGLIHGNIHGRNVLVAEIPTSSDVKHYVVKLSDFRFGKPVQKDAQNSLMKSSSGWIAPEMKDPEAKLGSWTDVFILGCFFHYVLSGGHHPYGRNIDNPNRESNILTNKPKWNLNKNKAYEDSYLELIKCMCSFKSTERPSTGQILRLVGNVEPNTFFHFYPAGDDIRPGLCVIFHQGTFNPVRIFKKVGPRDKGLRNKGQKRGARCVPYLEARLLYLYLQLKIKQMTDFCSIFHHV